MKQTEKYCAHMYINSDIFCYSFRCHINRVCVKKKDEQYEKYKKTKKSSPCTTTTAEEMAKVLHKFEP